MPWKLCSSIQRFFASILRTLCHKLESYHVAAYKAIDEWLSIWDSKEFRTNCQLSNLKEFCVEVFDKRFLNVLTDMGNIMGKGTLERLNIQLCFLMDSFVVEDYLKCVEFIKDVLRKQKR
eukprot:550186_1